MDRNREARRIGGTTNGLTRRRQRNSSLRDSPEEDGAVELQETVRLRDRGSKKDRDRDRDRLSRSKRRRGERLMHGSNREEGEDSSEESVDDDEEDEEEDAAMVRMLPPNPASASSITNHHPQRKSFHPAKVIRAAVPMLKVADEMIGVSVPRKARSVSAKRSHECSVPGGGGGGDRDQIHHRQASTSPARPSIPVSSSAPISPSSNSSVRKKMKSLGPKLRPPKMSKATSIQDDIEIEVAEVLFGLMRQSHSTSKQEVISNASEKPDSKDSTGTSNDVKSRVSSPISNSTSAAPQLPQNSNSSTAVAPKRKRPRPVKVEEENSTIVAVRSVSSCSASKIWSEQPEKVEVSSPKLKKSVESERENGGVSFDLGSFQAAVVSTESQPAAEPVGNTISDSKSLTVQDGIRTEEDTSLTKYEAPCGKLEGDVEDAATKPLSGTSEAVSKRDEKYKIDLMASPPSKSSPDRDGLIDFAPEPKAAVPNVEMDQKMEPVIKNEERIDKSIKQDSGEVVSLLKRSVSVAEEFEPQKQNVTTEGVVNLQLDLEKQSLDSAACAVQGSKQEESQKQQHQQQQCKASRAEPKIEKSARYTTLPLPMTVAGWPGALPPLGYTGQVPPLQGVTTLDGSVGSSNTIQPPLFPFSQPRPKKCATHYYIARTIHYQQFIRMNPFWPAAAGSAALCGTKPYNLNMVPSADNAIVGNPTPALFPGRVELNAIQEKNQVSASFSNHASKEKSSVAANLMDNSQQRKQLVLQQGSQPATAGNLLHGPAFIFPWSQQQAAVAVATRSGPVKTGSTGGNAVLSSASNSAPGLQGKNSSTAAGAASNMSFTYPNLAANEAQYMAVLQNNAYPFPIPSHVGAPPPYRGTHAQAIPFFNGSFYSSQMLHPSQLQQQQQQIQPQPQPVQQGHQNTSTSTSSSSSHKHQQNQQQLLIGGGSSVAGNSHNFSSKNRPQQPQIQQQQQNHHISIANQARQHESDMDAEGSTSTVDGRVSHAHKNIYGQNFALPIHAQNFALMSPAALVSGNHGEKQLQQQSLKGGMELIPSQAFAMSFASFSGAAPTSGIDFSSMVQNHAIFQSLPEATRQGYHHIAAVAAAAQAAQQKSSHQISEEGKTTGDKVNLDEDRKGMATKGQTSVGHSLVFSRPDSGEQSASTVLGNTVVDSSNRTLNLIPAPVNVNSASRLSSVTATGTASAAVNSANTQLQQQQLMIQLQKQQQPIQQNQLQQQLAAVSATRANKHSTASSGNVFSDRLPSSSPMSSKLPNGLSVFPQGLVQGGSPTQSPQWKNSVRTMTSSAPSLAQATSSLKNISQQQGRTQQGHSQISFGVNSKSSTAHGQPQLTSSNQSTSPPVAVGSPNSVSKSSSGGSPRTTSIGSKVVPAPTLSTQQANDSQSVPPRKSSPVGGRNVPSILGSSHVTSNANSGTKRQPQQQQHLHKQNLQQAHLFFSNAAYVQAQCLQSSATPTTSTCTAYYNQRRQPEQQQQQLLPVSSSSSTGMHCPPLAFSNSHSPTLDTAKAIAVTAAANGMKGVLPLHTSQFVAHSSAPFPYIHPVPALQVKPADQKQPARNDNLHACWQPEKR